jgi:hypothetical protein
VVLAIVVLVFVPSVSDHEALFELDAPFLVQLKISPVPGLEQLDVRLTDPPLLGSVTLDVPLTVATQPTGAPTLVFGMQVSVGPPVPESIPGVQPEHIASAPRIWTGV